MNEPAFQVRLFDILPLICLSGTYTTAVFRVINSTYHLSIIFNHPMFVCTWSNGLWFLILIDFWLSAIINYQKLIHWVLPDLFRLWDHKIKIKSVECGTQILLMIAFDQRMFCDCFWYSACCVIDCIPNYNQTCTHISPHDWWPRRDPTGVISRQVLLK